MSYILKKANDNKHKFIIETPTGKKIKFGAFGYEDYTIHKDKERKKKYITRHKELNEDWTNFNSRGFWSRYLLWNKDNLAAAIKYIKNTFHIKIIYRI